MFKYQIRVVPWIDILVGIIVSYQNSNSLAQAVVLISTSTTLMTKTDFNFVWLHALTILSHMCVDFLNMFISTITLCYSLNELSVSQGYPGTSKRSNLRNHRKVKTALVHFLFCNFLLFNSKVTITDFKNMPASLDKCSVENFSFLEQNNHDKIIWKEVHFTFWSWGEN